MREVAIIGVGQTAVAEHWHSSLRELAAEAVGEALRDAGIKRVDALYVGSGYSLSVSHQAHLGALVADHAGLRGVEASTFESGDASGGAALRAAYFALASGQVEAVLVVGVDKLTDSIGAAQVRARSVSLDADFELVQGATLPGMAALLMRRYMHDYRVDLAAFEGFSINAHANGVLNSRAMFRNVLKPGAFVRAPMVAEPVTLFDSAPDGDGAAALVLTTAERASDLVPQPVRLIASAAATDRFALQDREDMLDLRAARLSAAKAYQQAGIRAAEIDLFELHDAYTILAALSLEAAGFARRGEGWKLAQDGVIGLTGDLPISTFGGSKARGNPGGAVGVYQAVEAALQLRGEAGANQVAGARTAMIQTLGGVGSSAFTHILRR
jgi:acetyl-CoA C-acetyltransferase